MDTIYEILIQLGTTFAGVFLGFILARKWDKSKHKIAEKEIKNKTLDSLIEELLLNQTEVQKNPITVNETTKTVSGSFFTFSTSAFQSTIHSGTFGLISPKLQTEISSLYSLIEICNSFIMQIWNFPFSTSASFTGSESLLRSLIQRENDLVKDIGLQLVKLLSKVNEERNS